MRENADQNNSEYRHFLRIAVIATLKLLVKTIIKKYYKAAKDIDIHLQKVLLLITVAKLIKTDIKLINTNPNLYPSLETLEHGASFSFLSSSLHLFISNIIVIGNELKFAAIGQSSCSTTKNLHYKSVSLSKCTIIIAQSTSLTL